ncbi:MAG TPA: hemolysin family protein [Pyrinomonadaceae bacterium]|nr:hemolysin family protein [Pyrinomonadaceae bacterium]
MFVITFEILFIVVLLIANGVFAMSELAVVASRKTRLQRMADLGDTRASAALELAQQPDRFLSTIQIGITLIGIFAGAVGGATIAEQLGARISTIPSLAPYGEAIGLIVVVLSITYLSLVIGELVPKRLALSHPERVALVVAGPMRGLARLASPVVSILSVSTSAVLTLLRMRAPTEPPVTEDEIKVLIQQGTQAGVFEEVEQEMIESVFRLADRSVEALMTPRMDIVWLDVNDPPDKLHRKVAESTYSRFPVCRGHLDNLLGIVKAKEMLSRCVSGAPLDLQAALKQPLFIPESTRAIRALEMFKAARTHLALVIDEYGAVEGLVTTNDILEAIVGDIAPAQSDAGRDAVQREDGSWLLEGALPFDEFREIFSVERLPGEERGLFHTLAGFILFHLGRVPSEADHFEWHGLRFEIVDVDGKRIDKVLVMAAKPSVATRRE